MPRKTVLLMCLCQLYNFCFDCCMSLANKKKEKPLEIDDIAIACNGGIGMSNGGIATVKDSGDIGQLLHSRHPFDDIGEAERRRLARADENLNPFLPREKMLAIVDMKGFRRPKVVD